MSTILYFYDQSTGELVGSRPARVIPGVGLETPINSTTAVPPAHDATQAAVFADGAWTLVADNRGAAYKKADGSMVTVSALGALDPTLTLTAPTGPSTWDDATQAWTPDLAALRAIQGTLIQQGYYKAIGAGFTYEAVTYPGNQQAQYVITSQAMQATLDANAGKTGQQYQVGPSLVDGPTAIAINAAYRDWVQELNTKLAALQAQLAAANDPASIAAVVWA